MNCFIDWVSIRQQHQASEIVGKNVCIWLDPQDGRVLTEGVGYLSHEGSFSTAVSIRAYNGLVEWSGNPSRWGRRDNVFGYQSLRDCLDRVINPHLVSLGLPPFFMDLGDFNQRRLSREGASVRLADTAAVLTRVDICRNVSAGSPVAMRAYLRAASAAVYRNKGPSSQHEGSVAWGNARNSRLKFYDKGSELRAHTRKILGDDGADLRDYRNKLADWCYNNGVIRQEITFGRQALRSAGLRTLSEWSDDRAFELFVERVESMNVGCTAPLTETLTQFIQAGYTERQAATLSGIVSRWYMGECVTAGQSRATFYRYKTAIKRVLGIDISGRPDIAVLTARVQSVVLSPVSPPAWYQAA